MKSARRLAVRAIPCLCLAVFFALSGASSLCLGLSKNNSYYWSKGSGNNHLWGDDVPGGWWLVYTVIDRGGADHPNPETHYEWIKTDWISSIPLFTSWATFGAFNNEVKPKVFNVSLDGSNSVYVELMEIDNTQGPYYKGHDWLFTGDYSSRSRWNIFANDISFKEGSYGSWFTTTFDNLGVYADGGFIYDYNTLLVTGGSGLRLSTLFIDSGILDFRGKSLEIGSLTLKNAPTLRISAHGNSTNLRLPQISNAIVVFYDTYGGAPGDDYNTSNSVSGIRDSIVMIGDTGSPASVEFAGKVLGGDVDLIIADGSRLSLEGDGNFLSNARFSLDGAGTLRLTGDLLEPRINLTSFTGIYDLNGHNLWMDAKVFGNPTAITGGGELSIGIRDTLTVGGGGGLFQAGPSDDLLLSLNAVASGKLTVAGGGGVSTGGSLTLASGEGEIILSGGRYEYQRGITNRHSLTLTGKAELSVNAPYSLTANEGGLLNYGRLTVAGPATLHGDLAMPMNPLTYNSLVLKSRFTVDGDSLFINQTTIPGSPVFGMPIRSTFDYRAGTLVTTGELALNGVLFQANISHPGVHVMAKYGTLTGTFANAAEDVNDVSPQVKINGQNIGVPSWLVYNETNDRILLITHGSGGHILFRNDQTAVSVHKWEDGVVGWDEVSISLPGGISLVKTHWNNFADPAIAVFDSVYGTPGTVSVESQVEANMLSFLDNGWIIENDYHSLLKLFPLDPHGVAYSVLNSQAPDDPTFVTSPRIDVPMAIDFDIPLHKTGVGTLILSDGFYHVSAPNAPERVEIKEGRLILESNLALASNNLGVPYYSSVTIEPAAVLRLDFKDDAHADSLVVHNRLGGAGSLEIASGSAAVFNDAQPNFIGNVIVEAGDGTRDTVLRVGDVFGVGGGAGNAGDIVLSDGSSVLELKFNSPYEDFPHRITGDGRLLVEGTTSMNAVVHLLPGSTFTGGVKVSDYDQLYLYGEGDGKTFTAAGTGPISLPNRYVQDENTLRLAGGGGILENELSGNTSVYIGAATTFLDNNVRTDGTDFTGVVKVNFPLTLRADVRQGAEATPPFYISGVGDLYLDGRNDTGDGVTFRDMRVYTTNKSQQYVRIIVIGNTALRIDSDTFQVGDGGVYLEDAESRLYLHDQNFGKAISGFGTVELTDGAHRLAGDNRNFAGRVTIPGTLTVNSQNSVGTAQLALDNGTLALGADLANLVEVLPGGGTLSSSAANVTLSGPVTGAGSLSINADNILTLTGRDSDYSGPATVARGQLRLEDAVLNGVGRLTVLSGAALSGRGEISGDTVIDGGGSLSVDGLLSFYGERDPEGSLLAGTDLTLSPGASLSFNQGGTLDVTGRLDWGPGNAATVINLDSPGVHLLAKYGTTSLAAGIVDPAYYTVNYNGGQLFDGGDYRLVMENFVNDGLLVLIAMPNSQKIEFWAKDGGGIWNTDGELNWSSAYSPSPATAETWSPASRAAVFGADGAKPGAVRVQGPVSASGMFFISDGWRVSGDPVTLLDLDPADGKGYAVIGGQGLDVVVESVLTGGVGLHKIGAGHLALTAANTYTGDTLIGAGTLELGRIDAVGLGSRITIGDGATLLLAYRDVTVGLPQELAGSGTLAIYGEALLDRATPSFTGTAVVAEGGALTLRVNSARGAAAVPSFTLGGGGDVLLDGAGVTFSGLTAAISRYGTTVVTGGTALRVADGDETAQIGTGGLRLDGADSLLHLDDQDFTNALSGIGKVELSSGDHMLTGDNLNFAGLITVPGALTVNAQSDVGTARIALNGGVLALGAELANAVELQSGGGTLYASAAATLSGPVTGTGGLTKSGEGILTLTGLDNCYTGATSVAEGELRLDDAVLDGGGELTVLSGAALSGRGEISGKTVIDGGGRLSVDGILSFRGEPDQFGNLPAATDLTLSPGAGLAFNQGGMLDVAGRLDWGLNNGVAATSISLDSLGVHVLAKYGTTSLASGQVAEADYTVSYNGGPIHNDALHRLEMENFDEAGRLVLIAMPNGQKIEFWAKDGGGVWNTDGEANWSGAYSASPATMETWSPASRVAVFGAAGATPGAVRVQGPASASGMFFISDGWRVSGDPVTLLDLDPADGESYAAVGGQGVDVAVESVLTGAAGLHKSGAGHLALAAANTYAGDTLVGAGTLELGRVDAAGLGTTITIEDGATLLLAYRDVTTGLRQELTGRGKLAIGGEALLELANTFFTGAAVVAAGGALTLRANPAQGAAAVPSFTLGGGGDVLLDGAGVTFGNLTAEAGRAGTTVVTAGTVLRVADRDETAQIGTGGLRLDGADSLLLLDDQDFENSLSGIGKVELSGGDHRLAGDNRNFAGRITVPGSLTVNAQSEVGAARLALNGGVLALGADLANAVELQSDGGTLYSAAAATLSGPITGTGGLAKSGEGILTLTGRNNDYTGATVVTEGQLRLEDAVLNGGGELSVQSGAALSGRGEISGKTTIENGGSLSVDGLLSFRGEPDEFGDLPATDLTLSPGARLAFNQGGTLDVAGRLDWGLNNGTAATSISLDSLGVHVLAKYGTTSLHGGPVAAADYTVNYNGGPIYDGARYRMALENFDGSGRLVLIAMPDGQRIEFWARDGGGVWNTDGEANWSGEYSRSPATLETWSPASRAAVFGAAGITPGTVRVQGPVSASGLFFISDGWRVFGDPVTLLDLDPADGESYAVIGGLGGDIAVESVLTGGAGLHKSGAGHLALAAANTYTGDTLVGAGTLELGRVDAAGLGARITIEEGATLLLAYRDVATSLRQELAGRGKLAIGGEALLELANASFTGAAVVAGGGALTLRADSAQGAAAVPSFTLGGGGDVLLDGAGVTFGGLTAAAGRYGTTVLTGGAALRIDDGDETAQIGTGGLRLDGAESLLRLDDQDFANALSGIGTVELTGGDHRLAGDNRNFAGRITVPGALTVNAQSDVGAARLALNGGSLVLGADLANAVELSSGGGTLFSQAAATLNGQITGTGSLTKTGAGILTLTGRNNDYTGPTVVAEGQLRLEDAVLDGGGRLTVLSGAALSGRGEISGKTVVEGGGRLSADGILSFRGEPDQLGNQHAGTDLTLSPGAGLDFNKGGMLDVTGRLDWGVGGSVATVINLDSLGIHVLAKYGTTSLPGGPVAAAGYTVNYKGGAISDGAQYRMALENFVLAGRLVLIAMPDGQRIEFWAKDGGGVWNTDGEANWSGEYASSPATMETWSPASRAAVFGAAGSMPGTVRVQGQVSVSGMFFLSDGWRVSGDPVTLLDLDPADGESYAVIGGLGADVAVESVLTGRVGLHKSGAGHLALTAANTYGGDTLVGAGTLELGRVDAAGMGTEIAIEDGATLLLSYRDVATGLRQELTGGGTVEIVGEALLGRANQSFAGATRIRGGLAVLADAGAFGYGKVLFDGGTLRVADGLTIDTPMELRGVANIFTVGDSASATLSGALTGLGALIKNGPGTLAVNGDNTSFHGVTVAGAGTLVAGNDSAFGTDNLIRMESGAAFGFSGNRILENGFSLEGDAYFAVNSAAEDSILNGVIVGGGGLVKTGQGTLALGGLNTFSGMAHVLDGTLTLGPEGGIVGNLALHDGALFDAGGHVPRLTRLETYDQGRYAGDLDMRGGTMFFAFSGDTVPGQAPPMLLVSGDADIDGTVVGLSLGGRDRMTLMPGHTLTLVQSDGFLGGIPANPELSGHLGITRVWTAGLTRDAHSLYASIAELRAAPEGKALAEGFMAGLTLINQGADLVAGQGTREAAKAAERAEVSDGRRFGAFGFLSGGRSRHDTGSRVEVSGLSLVTGLSIGEELTPGRLTLGAVIEYGNGSYDTYNSFAAASIRGTGHGDYLGGGILGRMDFAGIGRGRFYAEASGRIGRLNNRYENSELRDEQGNGADYDFSAAYYGAHAGIGYLLHATDKTSLDLYGNFFWTRLEGDTVTLDSNDSVTFDAADSLRLRGGARFSSAVNEYVSPHIGLAYEHEFSGTAKSTTYGLPIDAPSLEGGTGIGEIGLSVMPSSIIPLTFELGVQGYMGKRKGVTVSLQIKYEF
ncbi:MAG: autotransporter-associated beta strand repeat-containing protein [Deltaproteobacteria bacterium]|jgi:autotransporter-associated beta strand protein|nr:autotransporter-associated beta strand repeat-containing protein [Deltaproteobacteria bacterium]